MKDWYHNCIGEACLACYEMTRAERDPDNYGVIQVYSLWTDTLVFIEGL